MFFLLYIMSPLVDFNRDEGKTKTKTKKQACTWAELTLKVYVLGFSRQLDIQQKKNTDSNSFALDSNNSHRKGVVPLVSMLPCMTIIPRIKQRLGMASGKWMGTAPHYHAHSGSCTPP